MTDPVADGARAAAQRLATRYGPALVADVEAALHARETDGRPERYFDPIALGSLIVSVAALAWTVYRDLKGKTDNPSTEVVERTVRTELRRKRTIAAQEEEIISITVEETLRPLSAPPALPPDAPRDE